MKFLDENNPIQFIAKRKLGFALSLIFIIISIVSLSTRGLNFGIDFTGGTLVEIGYAQPVNVEQVRETITSAGIEDAIVQIFGTPNDIMVRLPNQGEGADNVALSNQLMQALRATENEQIVNTGSIGLQQCISNATTADCKIQMRRVEFVGPQVGEELTNQGSFAMLYAIVAILLYVMFRFEWRFALGSIVALVHDVVITVGIFSLFQLEFSLPVLAAVLAIIGYSLNDTIVVFDRVRENFRTMRKGEPDEIINVSLTQTMSRTILTSFTTLLVVLALLIFGGEIIRGFSIALLIGVIIGTYSSVFVACPFVYTLGVSREDLIPVEKEGDDAENLL